MDNQNNQNNQKPNNNKNQQGISFVILVTLITTIMVLALYQFRGATNSEEISYNKFLSMVDKGEIKKVEIKSDKLVITAKKKGKEDRKSVV